MARAPKSQSVPPIAIFHGPQRFLQLQHTEDLRQALKAIHGDIAPTVFDGASAKPADILDECRCMSLMQQHRLVIVDNADALLKAAEDDEAAPAAPEPARRGHSEKTARELFENYAAAPDSSATLVLRAMTWRPGKIDKAVAASGGVITKCEEPKPAEAVAWATERATSHHAAKLDRAAAATLIDSVGVDLGRIDTELAKLALAATASGEKTITDKLVREMVGMTREEEFWAIQSSLLSGDPAAALTHLRELLDISRHDPTPLLFTYGDLARKLHAVSRGLAAREPRGSLMGRLRLWGPQGDALLAKGAKVNPAAAAELVGETVRAMVRQRTGDGHPEHILEGLTLRFAAVCAV